MFSIAAINDTDSKGQWEPLAPTKEAQEFHLSQTYHEGLLKLQAKDYAKARELLEAVLKDPILSSPQVGNGNSDGHLLQLRFLTLKNLATVFLEQGPLHYNNALQCYIQAVEIDENDSVVWNQLGTLACTMGLLSTSRWAFEQGLLCSPNNWNCMEKLLEILIAIGDEVACLSVADLILRHWPSHSRALHVKKTIENAEPIPFAPCGIDKLEPKHVRLKFPVKRKADETDENTPLKRHQKSLELHVSRATWAALSSAILSIFLSSMPTGKDSETSSNPNDALNDKPNDIHIDEGNSGFGNCENSRKHTDIQIEICLSSSSEIVTESAEGKTQKITNASENMSSTQHNFDESSMSKEKESFADKDHPQERRSTRLERLRSRKSGKEELDYSNLGKVVFRFLEPFVLSKSRRKDHDSNSSGSGADILKYSTTLELSDVVRFIAKASHNIGAHHIGHLLLEEVSHINPPYQDYFVKFLELEKLTRYWGKDRTPLCSLFLAELYYDQGSLSGNESKRAELFSEASYHLCKVIEMVALDSSNDLACVRKNETIPIANTSDNVRLANISERPGCDEFAELDLMLSSNTDFWVRFFWLSGRISLYSGSKDKACKEFCICLSLLRNNRTEKETPISVFLPHCKFVRLLSVDIICYEINLLNLDVLLGTTIKELIEKGMHAKCIDLLSPLLLPTTEVCLEILYSVSKESERVISLELSALDVLIASCEKADPINAEVYLNCHRRKLQILTAAAGLVDSQNDKTSMSKTSISSVLDNSEAANKNWIYMIFEEVKEISRVASQLKSILVQSDTHSALGSLDSIIGEIQSLLLTVMCNAARKIITSKGSGSGASSNHVDQSDDWCLIDAAITFCKLQHLNPSVPVKTQVDLIVAVHDLLAEYGLCCAGRDSKGEEGIFLKLAIKHLLALDMKLKKLTEGANGKEESPSLHKDKDTQDGMTSECIRTCEEHDKDEEGFETQKKGSDTNTNTAIERSDTCVSSDICSLVGDVDIENVELHLDSALDQCFFCLYGLNMNPDSSSEDDLAIHKNTNRGDYQTKEQCADVFQYILPYARALSRTGLIKLRRVFRDIRKHFPQPPDEILAGNAISKILDSPDLCEDKLSELSKSDGNWESIMNLLFPSESDNASFKALSAVGSQPYFEVYANLYHLIAQAEETSATDKHPGFVLKKEGEEFVEQSANLFKYDLLYNPLRFESWQKLANIYDEEVDLLLNDGSKHMNIADWRKNATLPQRVEIGRRRSRRCLLMSLSFAETSIRQSQTHELLALVYYDSLQNVVPFYDQRSFVPTRDAVWKMFSQNSMKHFEKAFSLKPEWLHAFYLGKLSEKLGDSPDKAFSYYSEAASLNPSAVDPVYRMHASRLKLLNTQGRQNLHILQTIAAYSFNQSTKEAVLDKLGWTNKDLTKVDGDVNLSDDSSHIDTHLLDEAWHILFDDCLSALQICVEGELKHYHKARYILAQGLYKRAEAGDMERGKDELSFCFKSSRSSFTINMWEIDGSAKRARRKTPGHGGNRRNLEVSLSESSRKFITCMRKYILLYLNLLEKTGDSCTLERAYAYLRTDKRFALCLGDIVPVGLGKYIQVLTSSIRNANNAGASDSNSLEQLLEKMFNLFMDHMNLWADISSLPEINNPDLSESNLYDYVHQYIHLLESDMRLEALEGINEKIRKRIKNPKLSNSNCAKVCRHASLAWCRCILAKLASITPLPPDPEHPNNEHASGPSDIGIQLFVDLQPDEFLSSSTEGPYSRGLDLNLHQALSRVKNVRIQQATEENLEAAATLMRCTYNFYRDSSCGVVPSGINLYTVFPSHPLIEECNQLFDENRHEVLDLSIPRKLLLWVYTLVHGRYSNISAVVKYCEEHARSRMRRAAVTASPLSQSNVSVVVAQPGGSKERTERDEYSEADDNSSSAVVPAASANQEAQPPNALPLQRCCNTTKGE